MLIIGVLVIGRDRLEPGDELLAGVGDLPLEGDHFLAEKVEISGLFFVFRILMEVLFVGKGLYLRRLF